MRALQYPILAFVPVVAAPTAAVYVSGQQTQPIFVQSFQYEEKAEPIVVSAPPETVTVDKWHKATAEPLRTQRLIQGANGSFVVVVTPQVPAVYVQAASPGPISVQSFQYDDLAKPVFVSVVPETITLDKWFSRTEEPLFREKRLIQYGINTAIAEERIYPDALQATPVTPTFKPHRRHLLNWLSQDVFPRPPAPETITLDKWFIQRPERLRPNRRTAIYQAFVGENLFNVPSAPPVSAVYISGQSCDPIAIQQLQYPDQARPLFPITAGETVTVDKWFVQRPELLHRIRRPEGLYTRDLISRLETTTPDKWLPLGNQPRLDLKRQQILYPSFSADSQLFMVPGAEVIRVDKWGRNYPDLIPRAKRLQHLYPNDAQRLLFVVVPMRIDWVTQTSQPQMRLKRFERLYPSIAYTRVILAASQEPAVWQNLATVTLNAADLATVTLLLENTGDPGPIVYEDVDTAVIAESTGTVSIIYEDTDIVVIKYEDTENV